MKTMKIHPVAKAFPTIPSKEMKQLREDIKANGIREKLLVNKAKDTIYDGRNRWMIATELGLKDTEVPMEVFTGNEDEIVSMILSRNLFRRHLSEGQRAAIAGKFLLPKLEKEAAEREKAGKKVEGKAGSFGNGNGKKGSVAEQFARDVKVSVHKAKQTIRARKRRQLGSVISGKKTLKEAAGKPTPRKQKGKVSFEDQVIARFVKWIKYYPTTQHREVKKIVADFLAEK